MDRPIIFHRVEPEVRKSAYNSFDNVDFVLTGFDGRNLDLNSVRLEGVLNCTYNGVNVIAGNEDVVVYFDKHVGAHSCFETIQTQIAGSVVENVMDYPRLVKMKSVAQLNQSQMFNSENVCELKAATMEQTRDYIFGEFPQTALNNDAAGNSKGLTPTDFSIKPRICLNQGLGKLAYSKSGDVILTVTIARKEQIFYGPNNDGNFAFNLSDLRVTFTSSPMMEGQAPNVQMATTISLKQSISSNRANISMKVPAICRGVSCSFQTQADQNSLVPNNLDLVKLPDMERIQFLFNDSTSGAPISFILDNNVDVLTRYIESFGDTGVNAMSRANVLANAAYGVGVDFGTLADLRNQKFSVQVEANINQATRVMYLYFHSFITV